jgi:hypothetical protein
MINENYKSIKVRNMKHFKEFMKDLEPSSEEEETTEEEVEKSEEDTDDVKDNVKEDDQERQRDAWYKGDEHVAQDKKANPRLYKKVPIKKKGLTIPKGHEIKDKQDRDREAFYKEK